MIDFYELIAMGLGGHGWQPFVEPSTQRPSRVRIRECDGGRVQSSVAVVDVDHLRFQSALIFSKPQPLAAHLVRLAKMLNAPERSVLGYWSVRAFDDGTVYMFLSYEWVTNRFLRNSLDEDDLLAFFDEVIDGLEGECAVVMPIATLLTDASDEAVVLGLENNRRLLCATTTSVV